MKVIFDDGKEIEFDENEVAFQDPRERIFKKDGIWYITKIINKDLAKWIDETKPMIIKEKKIPEKIKTKIGYGGLTYLGDEDFSNGTNGFNHREDIIVSKINEIIDYLKSKGEVNE